MSDVTQVLSQIESGGPSAADRLLPLVYDKLRKLAAARLAQERPGQALQATSLVHEAYLRLVGGGQREPSWNNRGHFFAAAAEAMRRILVDRARHKRSLKAGDGWQRVEISLTDKCVPARKPDIVALHEALERLETQDPCAAQLVKLRYFVGLTLPDAAQALGVSLATAKLEWAYAKSWLRDAARGRSRRGVTPIARTTFFKIVSRFARRFRID